MYFAFDLGALVDWVIAFTVVEGVALVLFHRATGRGLAPREFLANMAAGLCLMAALRCGVRDAGAGWVALFLAGAGVAHAADLGWRARRSVHAIVPTRPMDAGPPGPAARSGVTSTKVT
jgi:hypothetical protein